MVVFREWGIFEAVESCAIHPEAAIMRSYRDGRELSRQNLDCVMESAYTAPYLVIHRADLHKVLLQEVERLGVTTRLNSDITNIDFFKPSVTLSNGENHQCDIILGADGERSTSREAMLGFNDPMRESGDQVFRITVKGSDVSQHKDLVGLVKPPNINLWVGPDANAVAYLLRKDNLYNIVLTRARDPADSVQHGPQRAEINEVRRAFDQWEPRFKTLLNIAQQCSKWTLFEYSELPRWTHPAGKFALLGDSAHAMLPFL